jgi:hypothetical protein
MIDADYPPHILGIESRGHRGRTDEIAEHHGKLPALGGVRGCLKGYGSRRLHRTEHGRRNGKGKRGHVNVIFDRRRRPVESHSRETANDPVGEADPRPPIASWAIESTLTF